MPFSSMVVDSISVYSKKRARVLVARELSNMPARELAGLGFDSMLIAQGAKGWPWRVESKDELAELEMIWVNDSSIRTESGLGEAECHAGLNDKKGARLQVAQAA